LAGCRERTRALALIASLGAALALLALWPGQPTTPALADHCAVAPVVSRPTLSRGSAGDQVAILQSALNRAGISVDVTGIFGSATESAVRTFQQRQGIPVTGVVDSTTWDRLAPYIDNNRQRVSARDPSYGEASATFNAAGFNALFPGHPYFGLDAMWTNPSSSQPSQPYVPPTLLKAMGWIESSWIQADRGGAPLISFDCGYGVTQITYPGVPLDGKSWSMKYPAPEPLYSQVQVPIATSHVHNIAFGAKTLIAKWNHTPWILNEQGVQDPRQVESWYYALWAYNGFVYQNNPNNFPSTRGEYSCNLSDNFNHNRSNFPYQELVYGCMKHPPLVNGVPLWVPVEFSLPDPSLLSGCPSSCPRLNTPQPAHVDPTSGAFPPAVVVDTPVPGTVARQPFAIAGWAVDYTANSGSGIQYVHVWAYPANADGSPNGQPPLFVGAAQTGLSRPDLVSIYGNPNFQSAGYALSVRDLPPGYYRLIVYAKSSVTDATFESHLVLRVETQPMMAVDMPTWGQTVKEPFQVAGWALDLASSRGPSIEYVHVWAYPARADGVVTGPPRFLGAAELGVSRPDVGSVYGSQFNSAGFNLNATGLPGGYWRLIVYAKSAMSGRVVEEHRLVRVPPMGLSVDAPTWGQTVREPFQITGWALDQAAASGVGIEYVHVWAYPARADGVVTGPPRFLGAAELGVSRPDVGSVYGSQFNSAGFNLNATGLPGGYWRLIVYAKSAISGQVIEQHRLVQVPSMAMYVDVPAPGAQVGRPFAVAGWALDQAAASGVGIEYVHVWAYPARADGVVTGPPQFVGAAQLGGSRPDVGAVYGSQFNSAGFNLNGGNVSGTGYWLLIVYAKSAISGQVIEQHRLVQVTS